jgi:hypothetical protein
MIWVTPTRKLLHTIQGQDPWGIEEKLYLHLQREATTQHYTTV